MQLTQSFKEIRPKAAASLNEMATTLSQLGEKDATVEGRKAFVAACKPIWESSELDHDFVSTMSKKVTDSKKQIFEGVAKGVARVCKNHAS